MDPLSAEEEFGDDDVVHELIEEREIEAEIVMQIDIVSVADLQADRVG